MKLFMDVLFLIIIGYFVFTFIQLLVKMRKEIIFPVTEEQMLMIRKHPDKPLALPTYSNQKAVIIMYSIILLTILTMFALTLFTNLLNWPVYLLLFIPMTHASDLLNLFAVIDDGVLSGSRFVAWKNVKSFHFVPIDMDHKYYGYSKETNNGYELKIKTRGFPISCIVTTDEMKEKLTEVLRERVCAVEEASEIQEHE